MVVTARTADGQAEEGRPGGADDVVELVVPLLLDLVGRDLGAVDAGREEPGGEKCLRILRGELVAGELPGDEGVEGEVLVQGLDHEVAIVIGGGAVGVVLEAVALGEPGEVEPVPAPALAVTGTGQEPASKPVVRVGCRVIEECGDLLGRGRQAGQVEGEPAGQLPPVRLGIGPDSLRLEGGEDEPVDRVAAPGPIADVRRADSPERLECPVLAAGLDVDRSRRRPGRAARPRPSGPAPPS